MKERPIRLLLSRLDARVRKTIQGSRAIRYKPKRAGPATLLVVAACPVIFQSASFVLQGFTKGYDPIREAVSTLVLGPYGWVQTVMFYLTGASLIALAIVLHANTRPRFKWGFMVLALLGAAFTVIGINRAAAPGAEATFSSTLHVGAAIFIAAAFPIACLMLGPILRSRGHTLLRWYTIIVGVLSLLFFFVGGAVLVLHLSYLGLFERVMLWNGQLWVEMVCLQLLWDRYRARKVTTSPVG